MNNERPQNPSVGMLSAELAAVLTRTRKLERAGFVDRDGLNALASERAQIFYQTSGYNHRRLLRLAEDQVARESRLAENGPTLPLRVRASEYRQKL